MLSRNGSQSFTYTYIQLGSASNAWLTAAPKEILNNMDGYFFGLCSTLPAPADQYKIYMEAKGPAGAAQYARELSALWHSWTNV